MHRDSLTRRTVLHRLGTAGTVGIGLALAGCTSDGGDDGGGGDTVEMTDGLAFQPETLTVEVGTTVTWENTGSAAHTVTAYEDDLPSGAEYFASGGFDSESAARAGYPGDGGVGGGESYEHTFERAGTFPYFCIPHEGAGMTGEIVVE